MKIMSFNVKHNIIEDVLFTWKKRYKMVKQFIEKEDPDILGMQEITRLGNSFFKRKFYNYNIIGDSRHSSFLTNEYNPILIKKEFNILSYNTYSLSSNINKLGTKTDEDKFPRICVVAHVEKDEKKFIIVNTHLDNSGFENKKRLLGILEGIINKEKKKDEFAIIMGDFNMTLGNKNLLEFSKKYVNPFKDHNEGTFISLTNSKTLDYIFIDKKLGFLDDKIYKNSNDNGFLSDHNPISCCIKLKK